MTITLLTTTAYELHENYDDFDADEDDGRTREDQTSVPIFFSRHHEQDHRSLNTILRIVLMSFTIYTSFTVRITVNPWWKNSNV